MSQKGAPYNSNSGQSSRGGHRGGHQGGHRGGYKGGYKGNNHDGRQGGYQGRVAPEANGKITRIRGTIGAMAMEASPIRW